MTIRFATIKDIPGLVTLGEHMHALTRFRSYSYNHLRVAQTLEVAITNLDGRYACLVGVDQNQKIVGLLLAILEKHIFSELLNVSVMIYIVLPESRMGGYGVRLIKALEQWAKNRNVVEINLGVNSGDDQQSVGGFIQRMGYKKVGENYVK